MNDFVARPHAGRMFLIFLIAVAFVIVGSWLAGLFGEAPDPGNEWAGWMCIIFFGFGSIILFIRLFERGDQIRISSQGIYCKQWSGDTIPWSAIEEISGWQLEQQKLILLRLRDPSKFPSTSTFGKMTAVNRAIADADIALNLTGTDKSFDEAMAAIERFRKV